MFQTGKQSSSYTSAKQQNGSLKSSPKIRLLHLLPMYGWYTNSIKSNVKSISAILINF